MIRSPNKAPRPPNNTTKNIEFVSASSAIITVAGTAVKIETKKIPDIKLPKNFNSWAESRMFLSVPVFTKITAAIKLKAIIAKSLITL